MFDQCLLIMFIFVSHNAMVGGQGQYYPDAITSTTSLPTSTSMTSSRPTTTERIVGDYDYDLACAFDANGFCAWKNEPTANHSWLLNPLYDYDSILMGDPAAYPYIYIDKPSPRGNSSVRLISPLYSRDLDKDGCFSTSFKMYTNPQTSRSVGIRVYQKPDYIALEDLVGYSDEAKKDFILFEVWGDWGDYWYDKESTLKRFDSNFQIILEGNFGEDPMYIAVQFVIILQRSSCTGDTALTPRSTTSTSTTMSTTTSTTTTLTTTTQQPLTLIGPYGEFRCNFNDRDFCGWKNDPMADDEWFLYTNSSSFEDLYDYSEEGINWYPYFNKASTSGNGTVRLISPLYSRDLEGCCFHFSYRIHTASHGRSTGIRVYIKPEYLALEDLLAYSDEAKKEFILYDIGGDFSEETSWSWNETKLMNIDYNFQIIIEGIYGQDNIYMALDAIIISAYPECTPSVAPTTSSSTTTTPRPTTTTSPRPTTTTFSPPTKEEPRGVTGYSTPDQVIVPGGWTTSIRPTTGMWLTTARLTTTTRPPTMQSDSRYIQLISIIAILGIFLLTFGCILAVVLSRQRGTYRLNALRANIIDTSPHEVKHEAEPPEVRYSTKDRDEVVIHCNESNQQNGRNQEIDR